MASTPNTAPFATTIDYVMDVPEFAARAHLIEVPPYQPLVEYDLKDQFRLFWRVLRAARREQVLLLFSSRGTLKPELMAILAVSFWPRRWRPAIVLNGDMWQPNEGLRGKIEHLIIRLADRAVTRYAVYSSAELKIFPENWGIDPAKVRFTPYLFTISERDMRREAPPQGAHIFAGGNSFRDYDPLVDAARRMPEYTFLLATRRLDGRTDLPPNVIARQIPHEEFIQSLRSAAAVVVPMRQGLRRSTGHQTYLNGMWLKKPTIVNDVYGVRDHVRDHETGLIVDGTPEGYEQALRWVLDPANAAAVQQMCECAAQEVATRFNSESHARSLMAVVDDALTAHAAK